MARLIRSLGTVASSTRGVPASTAARVSVAAIGVIAEQHVRGLLTQNRGQPLGGFLHGGTHEAHLALRVGQKVIVKTGVGIAQPFDPGDPEGLRAAPGLLGAGIRHLMRVSVCRGRQSQRTIGGQDQDNAMTLRGRLGHGAGRQEGLVIRVCVEGHQRPGASGS